MRFIFNSIIAWIHSHKILSLTLGSYSKQHKMCIKKCLKEHRNKRKERERERVGEGVVVARSVEMKIITQVQ